MAVTIAIVDAGIGNIHSVYKALCMLGARPVVASSPDQVIQADKIIIPGVGHFAKAMYQLKQGGFVEALNEAVLVKKHDVLGICLGMQLMAKVSEEGSAAGLGWINGIVTRLRIQDMARYKVPQAGWNTIEICRDNHLLRNIREDSEFYFLHSYHYELCDQEFVLAKTNYEHEFASVIADENIFGTQFHPEKSHDAGKTLLQNFINH